MTHAVVFPSAYLASRRSAAATRRDIESALEDSSRVEIDLTSVRSISESYADELFGVLVGRIGLEELFSRVALVGASERVVDSIVKAVRTRLERDDGWSDAQFAHSAAQRTLQQIRQRR
jgi:STAS-like domain of unknown function (DUF4325)